MSCASLARNVILLFDADAAGSDAALRGLTLAGSPEADLRVRIATPPRGSDPAEVAAQGREAVERMLGGARSVLAFRVSLILDAADVSSVDGRTRAFEALQALLRDAPETPERDELVQRASSRLLLSSAAAAQLAPQRARRRRPSREEPPARLLMDAAQRDERLLVALALASGERGASVLERIPAEALVHDDMRTAHAWAKARLNQLDEPPVPDVDHLEAELTSLAARHGGPEALGEVAGRVESRWIERRLEPLKEKLAATEITPEEMRELQELQALARSAGGGHAPRMSGT